jgi:beta-xylosidase
VNPVINQDFPDPDSLRVADTYYVYATNSSSQNIQAAKSADLVHWQILKDALPNLPAWAEKGNTWAPEVTTTADGKSYIMYFVARHSASSKQCIGVATSATPEGPFVSNRPDPFICQTDQGGSIDPSSFVDTDGTRYVLWKNDGNCCSLDTWIYLQKVSADGQTLMGQPSKLIQEDQPWEGKLVEAPVLWKHNGKYDLFYSANNYAGADYAIGYALADTITGPYQKPAEPLVKTVPSDNGQPAVIGPGGEDIVVAKDGTTWMLYHSWDPSISYREMNIDKLEWNGDKPVLRGPTVTPESLP